MGPDLIAPPRQGAPAATGQAGRRLARHQHDVEPVQPDDLAAYTGWPKSRLRRRERPKSKKAGLYINKWAGNDVSSRTGQGQAARIGKEQLAALYYEFYLGLKGDIPNWRPPPCVGKATRPSWASTARATNVSGTWTTCSRSSATSCGGIPRRRASIQEMFDHILIDEAQDSNTIQHQIFDSLSGADRMRRQEEVASGSSATTARPSTSSEAPSRSCSRSIGTTAAGSPR